MKKRLMVALLACSTALAGASFAYAAETEADVMTAETEADVMTAETEAETEFVMMTAPEYNIADYLVIDDDDYKNISIQISPVQQVTDEEINSYIEGEMGAADVYEQITEGTVKEGDLVNIDYVGRKNGVKFDGGSAENYDLEIGAGMFIDGFEDGLIGAAIGDTVDLNLTFPEDYYDEELAGSDVVFTVTVNAVKTLPELTDEVAEKVSYGQYKTAEEYRQSIKDMIQKQYDDMAKNERFSALMNELVQMYVPTGYPQEYIDYYVGNSLNQMRSEAEMYGMTFEEYLTAFGADLDTVTEYYTSYAKSIMDQDMILGSIAEREGITLTDEELDVILQDYADTYGTTVEEIKATSDMVAVRNGQLDVKVLDWLSETVNITEVEETEAELYLDESFFDETEADTEVDEANDVAFVEDTEAE